MAFETYRTEVPGWATSLELVQVVPDDHEEVLKLKFEDSPTFVVATLTLPGGERPPWDLGRIVLESGDARWSEPLDDERRYVNERRTLCIVNRPNSDEWSIGVEPRGPVPVALNFMAFLRRDHNGNPPSPPPPPQWRCRGCKITVKALALAIAAAAMLPALPSALIAAVASYLGVGHLVAGAFITSVLGDTVDIIAEKLCKLVGLC